MDLPDPKKIADLTKKTRSKFSATLESIIPDKQRGLLLGENRSEAHRFVVRSRERMKRNRRASGQNPGFIDGYRTFFTKFYDDVVRDITVWQPTAPTRIVEAEEAEIEVPND